MQRRTVLLGIAAAALPLPAFGVAAPRWRSMSKRRFGPTLTYRPPESLVRLPLTGDVPHFAAIALKLTGGTLRLDRVDYIHAGGRRQSHAIDRTVARGAILALPSPAGPLIAVYVFSGQYVDGNRYWHLLGTNDPVV
jgi:hypothetical protein